jgi:hypothetical protein
MLHLLTGEEPYEELLRDVHCPEYLVRSISSFWVADDICEDSPYYVLYDLMNSLDTGEDADEQYVASSKGGKKLTGKQAKLKKLITGPGAVLFDTLYRYLVLFGIPTDFVTSSCPWIDNPVWNALVESLNLSSFMDEEYSVSAFSTVSIANPIIPSGTAKRGKGLSANINSEKEKLQKAASSQFRSDFSLWSLRRGTHRIINR